MSAINNVINGAINGVITNALGGSGTGDSSYPVGAYHYWDAVDNNSYPESGEYWDSLTNNPQGRLINGADDIETLRNFDFIDNAGEDNDYFQTDGVNYFSTTEGKLCDSVNSISESWTITMAITTTATFPANDILWSADASDPNLIILFIGNSGTTLRLWQEGAGSGAYRAQPAVSLSTSTPTIISVGHDHINNLMYYSVNGRTYATEPCTFVAPDASVLKFNFLGRETSSLSMDSGGRLHAIAYYDHVASNSELSAFTDFVNERHAAFNIP